MEALFFFLFVSFMLWSISRTSARRRKSGKPRTDQTAYRSENKEDEGSLPPLTSSSPWQNQAARTTLKAGQAAARVQTMQQYREWQSQARRARHEALRKQLEDKGGVKDKADRNRARRADWGAKGDHALLSNRNLLVIAIFVIIGFYVISEFSGQGAL